MPPGADRPVESRVVPPGPYRNEVTTSFRAGMPLRKHRQHFKKYGNSFTAGEAVDWLYDLLRNNSNFGPEVTRQQLLRKFLKNRIIEDIKGRWGSENVDDNNQLFRFPATLPLKTLPRRTPEKHGLHLSQENAEKIKHEIINEDQENAVDDRELSQEDVEEVWRYFILIYLQTILGVPSLEEVINPKQVIPQYIMGPIQFQIDPVGYIKSKMIQSSKFLHLNNLNSFKSTECLLLSLLHREKKNKEESDSTERLQISNPGFQERCAKKMQLVNLRNRRVSANDIMGGSCHNLIGLSSMHDLSSNSKPRCYSLEGIVDVSGNSSKEASSVFHQSFPNIEGQNNKLFLESKPKQEFLLNLHSEENIQKPFSAGFKRTSTLIVQDQEELCNGKCKSEQLCRSQSLLLTSSTRRNMAEITMKPNVGQGSTSVQTAMESELGESSATINKRLCKSTIELSEDSLLPASSVLTGTQSLLQPHLERVAIDALQLCCLLFPPPNHRKLQLLMRMISRMSQNVDMPKLHDAVGARSLLIHTFSQCVLCCAEEVDLDELLAGRLVSFLMDHDQEILQVPSYLQTAVEKHLDYLKRGHIESPGGGLFAPLPTYSYGKQISAQEFDEQKISTSQAAIAELLENIFQKEYPLIYQKRFPTMESEAALFGDKPTIKQPMLILRKPKFCSLRY
uniref:DEP domain-containing protein n=1 Tax=Pan troglodytes TaxID=9598 RepID=A0A2I3RQ91_PANTR